MDISELIDSKDYIVIPRPLLRNAYYQWMLDPMDKAIINCLYASVGYKNNLLYDKGLLVSNIKEKKLIAYIGKSNMKKEEFKSVSPSVLRRHIAHLYQLGIIIRMRRKYSTNYIVGFRSEAEELKNNNYYFLYHLCSNYENKLLEFKSSGDIEVVSLPKHIRDFIKDNYTSPVLFRTIMPSGKTIFEELFKVKKYVGWAQDQVEQKIIPLHSNRVRSLATGQSGRQ